MYFLISSKSHVFSGLYSGWYMFHCLVVTTKTYSLENINIVTREYHQCPHQSLMWLSFACLAWVGCCSEYASATPAPHRGVYCESLYLSWLLNVHAENFIDQALGSKNCSIWNHDIFSDVLYIPKTLSFSSWGTTLEVVMISINRK